MGRSRDIEAEYRLHKKLSDSQLEQMRNAYHRASETMLQTTELHRDNAETMRREFRAVALRSVGFTDEDIKQVDLGNLTADQFQELVKNKLGAAEALDTREQIIVTPEEAENYLNPTKLWTLVGTLANGKVVIELPASSPKLSEAPTTQPALTGQVGSQPQPEPDRSLKASAAPTL